MARRKKDQEPIVAIIRDPADATRDYYLPYRVAKTLYESGKLAWDLTNGTYCEAPRNA